MALALLATLAQKPTGAIRQARSVQSEPERPSWYLGKEAYLTGGFRHSVDQETGYEMYE